MARLLIHAGTGTIIDADDEVLYVDAPLSADLDDEDIISYAERHGKPLSDILPRT